jgi:hypothetical protein
MQALSLSLQNELVLQLINQAIALDFPKTRAVLSRIPGFPVSFEPDSDLIEVVAKDNCLKELDGTLPEYL